MKARRMTMLVPATILGALLTIAGSAPQAGDPGVRLRAAIEKEEVDGDLQAAIDLYAKIVADHGGNRAVAAKALLRLGGCYEKLGQGQARKTYQQLVADYPEQQQEVSAARQRLAALPREAASAAPGPTFRRIQIPGKPVRRSGAMLSPDGMRFAFVAEGGIWTVPLTGKVHPDIAGEPTRLTPDMGAWDNGNMSFSWSYDGQWIAFRGRPDDTVYLVPSTGGEPKKIDGSGPSGQGVRPSVSPGGRDGGLHAVAREANVHLRLSARGRRAEARNRGARHVPGVLAGWEADCLRPFLVFGGPGDLAPEDHAGQSRCRPGGSDGGRPRVRGTAVHSDLVPRRNDDRLRPLVQDEERPRTARSASCPFPATGRPRGEPTPDLPGGARLHDSEGRAGPEVRQRSRRVVAPRRDRSAPGHPFRRGHLHGSGRGRSGHASGARGT